MNLIPKSPWTTGFILACMSVAYLVVFALIFSQIEETPSRYLEIMIIQAYALIPLGIVILAIFMHNKGIAYIFKSMLSFVFFYLLSHAIIFMAVATYTHFKRAPASAEFEVSAANKPFLG